LGKKYFLLEDALLMDELEGVKHDLIVDGGETGDDLEEEIALGIGALVVARENLEDVAIKIEAVLEVSDFVFELVVLFSHHLLHIHLTYKYN
jgi:hypothetical protein